VRIDTANGIDAPLHLAVEIVASELQPVDAFRIGSHLDRRLDIVPSAVAVTVPHEAQTLERAVFLLKPFPERGLGVVAIVDIRRIIAFVPDVVTVHRRMIFVAACQFAKEAPGGFHNFRAVQAQGAGAATVIAESTSGRADAHQ
jgi:hypothetical protein